VQVIGLDALADVKSLEHAPALVDVAHEADVGPDGFPDAADAVDLNIGHGAARQSELGLHRGPAALD
jgi:hypothetical protein